MQKSQKNEVQTALMLLKTVTGDTYLPKANNMKPKKSII